MTNGSDLFCIVNASLTADTCAKVCSAFARAGNRQSADLRGITSSGFVGYSTTTQASNASNASNGANLRSVSGASGGSYGSDSSSQYNSNNNSTDLTGNITPYAFTVSDQDPVLHTRANETALLKQTQLNMGNMTLKISHSSPVNKDKV